MSQTCSGIMYPSLAVLAIVCRKGRPLRSLATSYSPRSPVRIGHGRPNVTFPNSHAEPSACSP